MSKAPRVDVKAAWTAELNFLPGRYLDEARRLQGSLREQYSGPPSRVAEILAERFAHGRRGGAAAESPPEIAFPPDGARVELGLGSGEESALALKVQSGTPPFTWFANGAPVAKVEFGREAFWQPDGRGFFELTVIDGRRQAARARIFLD